VDDATTEVKAARTEIDDKNATAKTDLTKARERLANMHAPEAEAPLANTIGISPTAFNIMVAALGVVGLSGLASCLLFYGSHRHQPRQENPRVLDRLFARMWPKAPSAVTIEPTVELPQPPPRPKLAAPANDRPAGSVPEILADVLEPAKGHRVEALDELYPAYAARCAARGKRAVTPEQFVDPAKKFCSAARIKVRVEGEAIYLMDVRLAVVDAKTGGGAA
jgi:hypothetical protein